MRIAVIYNMVIPYQVPVFERLAARTDVELLVVYETAIEANRQWQRPLDLPYKNVVLDSWSLDLAWLAVGSGTKLRSDIYLHLPKHPLAALKRFGPDAVVASGGTIWASPTNLAALAARRQTGWAFVPRWETHSRARPTLPRRLADPWVRRFFRSGDAWLAVGSRSEHDLVSMGADASRVFRWPLVSMTENEPPRKASPLSTGRPPRYLFVGQLIERKGIEELLVAWRRIGRGELWIAGDGPLQKLVVEAAQRDPRIIFHGHTSWERTAELYREADVVVFPSRYDTWGMVVNEALIHGLPIIATTEIGAVDDLVEDGVNGVVIPPKDVPALESAMRVVASWSGPRITTGAALSRKKLEAWTFDQAADGIVNACRAGVEYRRPGSLSA
jgi:glycosyltransferase involved in cell wall biosynthesis